MYTLIIFAISFMCMHVTAARVELNEARISVTHTNTMTNEHHDKQLVPWHDLLKFIYKFNATFSNILDMKTNICLLTKHKTTLVKRMTIVAVFKHSFVNCQSLIS